MRLYRFAFYLLLLSILFVFVQTSMSVWESHYSNVLYIMNMLAPVISLTVLILVIRQQNGASKRFWLIIAIAIACELIAQTIWGAYGWLWSTEAPEIGIADLFWISTSFLYLIALYFWLENSGEKIRYLFDSAILLVSLSVISWEYLMKPIYYGNTGLDFITLSVDLIYPVTSLLMIFTMAVWLLNGERRLNSKALAFLVVGFFCYLCGDSLYVFLIDVHHMESLETWIDPFWSSTSLCMALAGIYSLQPATRPITIVETRSFRVVRFSVPYIGVFLFVGIQIGSQRLNGIIVAGLTITVLLILIRQVMFLLDREKILDQLKQALERSEYLASYDSLTGLLNRRMFEQELVESLSFAVEKQERVAVLFFDLDKFKSVNDRYGHRTGDLLLQAVGERINQLQHQGMHCARLGGDEFAVSIAIPKGGISRLDEIAGIIVRDISQTFDLEENSINISPSIGIAIFPDHALNVTDLIKRADQAMYLAKRDGGGGFSY